MTTHANSLAALVLVFGLGCAGAPQCPIPSEPAQRELLELAQLSQAKEERWSALNIWVGQMANFCDQLRAGS